MKLTYFPDVDVLNIDLSDATGTDAEEVDEHVIFDYDAEGRILSIEIHHARRRVDLECLRQSALFEVEEQDPVNV